MASASPGDAAEPFSSSSSLFEGMVLFPPSDPSPPAQPTPPRPSSPPRHPEPFDVDLFSDLTLLPAPDSLPSLSSPEPSSDPRNHALLPRQISRRKKRGGVRIGYAREAPPPPLPTSSREMDAGGFLPRGLVSAAPRDDRDDASSTSSAFSSAATEPSVSQGTSGVVEAREEVVQPPRESGKVEQEPVEASQLEEEPLEASEPVDEGLSATATVAAGSCEGNEGIALKGTEEKEEEAETSAEVLAENDDAFVLTEGNLELIRSQVSQRMEEIRELAGAVCSRRKELATRRREAAVNVSLGAKRRKELEKELEEACEAEDFEKAERVSEELAAAEGERDKLLDMLREAEVECDAIESRMQEILQMQIAAEEEGTHLLEQFAKDAIEDADLILKNAEEFCSREIEEWQSSSEALELKRLEIEVEMRIMDEARSGVETSIEQLIQDEKREKTLLCNKQDVLMKELEDLLQLVRLKEAEITENNFKIIEVEKKISNVVNGFDETKSGVDAKYEILQSALSKVDSESETLSIRKKHIDENFAAAEHKRSKLIELANISGDEAKKCHDLVGLRKTLASPILKAQEDRMKLATTEKQISNDIQILQEQISAARSSMQELSLNRSSIEEEVAFFKQRVAFIDKKIPELESEKKMAAAARNFKEAGRVAAEAKLLSSEKENVQLKMEDAVSKLAKLEEAIQKVVNKIHESETLALSKEKEAARAGYQRLCLAAAAARAERFGSLVLGDMEGDASSLEEAETAESKARELLEPNGLDREEMECQPEEHVSLSLLISLSGKRLALVASSLGLPDVVDD